jgi:phospholipid/cholesterol/gamma-HCH transport system permease protein
VTVPRPRLKALSSDSSLPSMKQSLGREGLSAYWTHKCDRMACGMAYFGQAVILLKDAVYFLFQPNGLQWRLVAQSVLRLGVSSIPMMLLIAYIVGSVMTLQVVDKFRTSGGLSQVGGLVSLAIVKEIGPIFTSMTIAAKNGTSFASEVANMVVSDQLTALRVFQINPVRLLLLPQLVAMVWSIPFLTILFHLTATLGGVQMAWLTSHLHMFEYLESVSHYVHLKDLYFSLGKSILFGMIVVLVAYLEGVRAARQAEAVGRASTQAAVRASVLIMAVDLLMTLWSLQS